MHNRIEINIIINENRQLKTDHQIEVDHIKMKNRETLLILKSRHYATIFAKKIQLRKADEFVTGMHKMYDELLNEVKDS